MTIDPKPGLVIRYDFLWDAEYKAGQEHGRKDRPCAIVVAAPKQAGGSRKVVLCAITHTPPTKDQNAVALPPKVAQYLGLDQGPSWIKTHEVNTLIWEDGRIPYGVTEARDGKWSFGQLPQKLGQSVFDNVRKNMGIRRLKTINRDDDGRGR